MAFASIAFVASCDGETGETEPKPVVVTAAPYGEPFDKLSEWHLFSDGAGQTPAERVVPYSVISPLFSDYATKTRFLYLPPGETIQYDPTGGGSFLSGPS